MHENIELVIRLSIAFRKMNKRLNYKK